MSTTIPTGSTESVVAITDSSATDTTTLDNPLPETPVQPSQIDHVCIQLELDTSQAEQKLWSVLNGQASAEHCSIRLNNIRQEVEAKNPSAQCHRTALTIVRDIEAVKDKTTSYTVTRVAAAGGGESSYAQSFDRNSTEKDLEITAYKSGDAFYTIHHDSCTITPEPQEDEIDVK